MSHISIRAPGILPILSTELARMVEARASTNPDTRDIQQNYPTRPTRAQWAEAVTALPTYEAALMPPSRDALIAWAEPINAAVRNPQGREDFLIRVSVWAHALSDVPARCFTPEIQREALRTFQFWPSAAEIFALVEPQSKALKAAAKALEQIADPASVAKPTPREEQTQEVRDAVAAKLRLLTVELQSAPLPVESERPNARHLTRAELNATYAAMGITGPKVAS